MYLATNYDQWTVYKVLDERLLQVVEYAMIVFTSK